MQISKDRKLNGENKLQDLAANNMNVTCMRDELWIMKHGYYVVFTIWKSWSRHEVKNNLVLIKSKTLTLLFGRKVREAKERNFFNK